MRRAAPRSRPARLAVAFATALALSFALAAVADEPEPVTPAEGTPLRVLLIGHSYYYFNNLPAQLETLSESLGRSIEIESLAHPGATLKQHRRSKATRRVLATFRPDVVVLSDNSLLGGRREGGRRRVALNAKGFYKSVRKLDRRVSEVGASTVLFLNWSRRDIPGDQPVLNAHYQRIATEIDAVIAPVGPAWRTALGRGPELDLYRDDGSHPTPTGSYLAACVLFATLFDASPVGGAQRVLGPDPLRISKEDVVLVDLPEAEARLLQETAWAVWERFGSGQPLAGPEAAATKPEHSLR